MRVAVDAMGGDDAPRAEIDGALAAAREHGASIVLVGDRERLDKELADRGGRPATIEVRHASQVITMADHPASAVKSKKDSSMRVCFDLVKSREVDAVVSAGNSGAMLACGLFVLKRLRGVDRPGIITLCPTTGGGHCVVLDVGANTEVRPITLAQFAVMGSTFARLVLGKERPRVAVLSNGEEQTKGTPLTRETHRLLHDAKDPRDFDFVGYFEGRDFFSGRADVIVTDGYTGNVALKTTEGVTRFIVDVLKGEAAKSLRVKLGALLMRPAFNVLKRRISDEEYGGAPLLGVDGVVIICHGKSTPEALKNGILTAARFAERQIGPAIALAIAKHQHVWSAVETQPSLH